MYVLSNKILTDFSMFILLDLKASSLEVTLSLYTTSLAATDDTNMAPRVKLIESVATL